jgi:hypothetical protein
LREGKFFNNNQEDSKVRAPTAMHRCLCANAIESGFLSTGGLRSLAKPCHQPRLPHVSNMEYPQNVDNERVISSFIDERSHATAQSHFVRQWADCQVHGSVQTM